MTHTHVPGLTSQSPTHLSGRENQRAVDLIESAERSNPYCACGEHMIAVAHDEYIWLECSSRMTARRGFAGLVDRLVSFTHTRRIIMEAPSA